MKNFFYYSKGQRMATMALIALILLVMVGKYLLQKNKETTNWKHLLEYQEEMNQFITQLEVKEPPKHIYTERSITNTYTLNVQRTLFQFDPNLTDSTQLVALGISPKVAKNIVTYRTKGGVFKTPDDFSKIYGITEARFKELRPYIRIAPIPEQVKEEKIYTRTQEKRDTILELNSADTTALKLIKGIGSAYARSIINYRNRLGGFYQIEQLSEVPNLQFETYLQIAPMFSIDTTQIRPILVNKASVNQLRNHPYLNFTQAQAIYEYRRNKFKIKEIEEILVIESISDSTLIKLKPYLSFE